MRHSHAITFPESAIDVAGRRLIVWINPETELQA